ncbi:MAG: NAD-dependent epimerase/dehydratase family protein [Anaerolineae bacterium]|nr:NAD-dependent epimerase/dehydratase family protein [Anaerolineae bacterium]
MNRSRLFKEVIPRMLFDALMVNIALAAAFSSWFFFRFWLWRVFSAGPEFSDLTALFDTILVSWWISALCATVLGLLIFWFSGFYTYRRVYQGKYKLLAILQAVSLLYLVLGLIDYLVPAIPTLPRVTYVLGWLYTLAAIGGPRLLRRIHPSHAGSPVARPLAEKRDREIERILVIGGAGYIGSALTERLLELGYRVRLLDLMVYGEESIAAFRDHPNLELVREDFRNIHSVVRNVQGMDAIVHLGAIVGDSASALDEELTVEVNFRATRIIAEVGKGMGVKRFVFASTCSVYGASDQILDEKSALNPISLYARTKMESEKVLLELTDADFAPTILRFGTIYGLSGRPRFDLVVNLLAAKAIQEGKAGIFGGSQWRPLVHVRDVAEAIILALQAPLSSVRGQIFNVGSNEQNYQIVELGHVIKEMVPSADVVTQPQEDNRNYRVRFDKIETMLNFQPQYTVRDGVQEIIDAFASGRITDYREPHYSNLGYLTTGRHLRPIFTDDMGYWDVSHISAEEMTRAAKAVMAIVESQSPEMLSRLREALTQVILGDLEGFAAILDSIEMAQLQQAGASADSQPSPP